MTERSAARVTYLHTRLPMSAEALAEAAATEHVVAKLREVLELRPEAGSILLNAFSSYLDDVRRVRASRPQEDQ